MSDETIITRARTLTKGLETAQIVECEARSKAVQEVQNLMDALKLDYPEIVKKAAALSVAYRAFWEATGLLEEIKARIAAHNEELGLVRVPEHWRLRPNRALDDINQIAGDYGTHLVRVKPSAETVTDAVNP